MSMDYFGVLNLEFFFEKLCWNRNCFVNYPDAVTFLTTAKLSMALLKTKILFFKDLY